MLILKRTIGYFIIAIITAPIIVILIPIIVILAFMPFFSSCVDESFCETQKSTKNWMN